MVSRVASVRVQSAVPTEGSTGRSQAHPSSQRAAYQEPAARCRHHQPSRLQSTSPMCVCGRNLLAERGSSAIIGKTRSRLGSACKNDIAQQQQPCIRSGRRARACVAHQVATPAFDQVLSHERCTTSKPLCRTNRRCRQKHSNPTRRRGPYASWTRRPRTPHCMALRLRLQLARWATARRGSRRWT